MDAEADGYGSGSTISWTSLGETFKNKDTGIRIVVILTCCLSILGSLLIIFSFACFKQLRSKPREILLHISLMDFGVSLSNLIGAAVYFDQYYHLSPDNSAQHQSPDSFEPAQPVHQLRETNTFTSHVDGTFTASETINSLCITQAFFAGYFTLSSILWTIFLSIYIYLFLLYHATKPRIPRYSLFISYLVSYGTPLLVALWLALTHRLGYAPYNSSGWCSLIVQDPSTGEVDIYAVVFGNDLWIYLAIILIPILYLASRNSIHKNLMMSSDSWQKKQYRSLVYKFLFIPILFLVLRVWTCLLIILYTYVALPEKKVPPGINDTLLYLAGIGDSGQGLANGILFILFSRMVRNKLWRCLLCKRQVVDISGATTVNSYPVTFEGQSDSPDYGAAEDTFLCESLDNTSLN